MISIISKINHEKQNIAVGLKVKRNNYSTVCIRNRILSLSDPKVFEYF